MQRQIAALAGIISLLTALVPGVGDAAESAAELAGVSCVTCFGDECVIDMEGILLGADLAELEVDAGKLRYHGTLEMIGVASASGGLGENARFQGIEFLHTDLAWEDSEISGECTLLHGEVTLPISEFPVLREAEFFTFAPRAMMGVYDREEISCLLEDPERLEEADESDPLGQVLTSYEQTLLEGVLPEWLADGDLIPSEPWQSDDFERLPLPWYGEGAPDPKRPSDCKQPTTTERYLAFQLTSGLDFSLPLDDWLGIDQGAVDFGVPFDTTFTVILDPWDPGYFYFAQDDVVKRIAQVNDKLKEGKKPKPDDGSKQAKYAVTPSINALAWSESSTIPFSPKVDWGLEKLAGDLDFAHFQGDFFLDAQVSFGWEFPCDGSFCIQPPSKTIRGQAVTSFAEYADGSTDRQLGINGRGTVDFALGEFLGLSIELGKGSFGFHEIRDVDGLEHLDVYVSGVKSGPGRLFPDSVPLVPAGDQRIAMYFDSSDPLASGVTVNGSAAIDMEFFSDLAGVDLSELAAADSEITLSPNLVELRSTTRSAIHGSISASGSREVYLRFSAANPVDSFMRMSGDVVVGGVGLSPAVIEVGGSGLLAEGTFVTPLSAIQVAGAVTNQGPSLRGLARVELPLDALNAARDEALEGVEAAQAEVDKLDAEIAKLRSTIQWERDVASDAVWLAQSAMDTAQSAVNSLNSKISSNKKKISKAKKAIKSKYRWYKKKPWYKKTWAYGVYAAYKASKLAYIGTLEAANIGLKASLVVARESLDLAKAGLGKARAALDTFPIDADPRMLGLYAAREVATAALAAAHGPLTAIPEVSGEFIGEIELRIDHTGASGTVVGKLDGKNVADGFVTLGARPQACVSLAQIGDVCAPF